MDIDVDILIPSHPSVVLKPESAEQGADKPVVRGYEKDYIALHCKELQLQDD